MKKIIGMLHLLPLPGAPAYDGNYKAIKDRLLKDADTLAQGGVHALMIENFGDAPFYPGRNPAHVIAHLCALAQLVKQRINLPLGINVLRNDGQSALAIAQAVGAQYIRVNVLCGARVADQGVLNAIAHDLLRERMMLGAQAIDIWADVDVKHSAPLAARPIEDEVDDTIHRGMASALIVSGAGTGKPTDLEKLKKVKNRAGKTPVYIGSGITPTSVGAFLPFADGFIVGTALKKDHLATNPVELKRVKQMMAAIR